MTLTVPQEKSIYEVCGEAGVDVLGSCMEGVRGRANATSSRATPITVTGLNNAKKAANQTMMICVSTYLREVGTRPMRLNYPFNCWYVAASSDEVGQELLLDASR